MSQKRINAIELLEKIQSCYFLWQSKDDYIKIAMEKVPDDDYVSKEEILSMLQDSKPISQYQDPFLYYDINEISRDIKNYLDLHAAKNKIEMPELPIIGSIPIPAFMAKIKCAKKDTLEIILLSNGLLFFANAISSIFAQALSTYEYIPNKTVSFKMDLNQIKQNIIKKDLCNKFKLIIQDCFRNKDFMFHGSLLSYTFDTEGEAELSGLFSTFFIRFVIAHEYGHFLLGHTNETEKYRDIILDQIDDEISYEVIYHNWKDELEADILGSSITMQTLVDKGHSIPFAYVGIYLCLKTFELFEKMGKHDENIESSHTHPPYMLRRKVIEANCGNNKRDYYDALDCVFNLLNSELS